MQGHYWLPLFHPSSLLLLEAQLPPLKLTLEHQTLYSFERALRLPPSSPAFMPWQLETFPVDYRRNPPVDHFVLQPHNHSNPHASFRSRAPLFPHGPTHYSVSPFISDCSGNSTSRLQIASSGLSSLPPSDIQVLTDGSVPSLFGPGGAGVYAPNATHRVPYPFPPVQLPPASQLKPLPSSKVSVVKLKVQRFQLLSVLAI